MKEDFEELIAKHQGNLDRELPKHHRVDFIGKLDRELHQKKNNKPRIWMVAAMVIVLLSLGYLIVNNSSNSVVPKQELVESPNNYEISPELKKIENYYLTAINYELANLQVSDKHKVLLNTYLSKIEKLTKEYKLISNDLITKEINEEIVNKLIDNLQMRLQLLIELKSIINKTKANTNEKVTV